MKNFTEILQEAHEAGVKAATSKEFPWYPCGFAWVSVKNARYARGVYPNTGKFVAFLRKLTKGERFHPSGWFRSKHEKAWMLWVTDFKQCMEQKYAYAAAYASVLQKYGIHASSDFRLD